MAREWIPPQQFARQLPPANLYSWLYFTNAEGWPLAMLAAHRELGWQMPGGLYDHGDQEPFATAVRETREETGIRFTGDPVFLGLQISPPGRHSWPYLKIGVCFDGGILTPDQVDAIRLDPDEHSEFRVLPLEDWEQSMGPETYQQTVLMDQARRTQVPYYLGL